MSRRWLWRVALAIAGMAVLSVGALAGLWLLLQPPHLDTPERRDWTFTGLRLAVPGEPLRAGTTLRVREGRIESLAPDGAHPRAAGDRPDLAGLVVVPGLVDMHVHYAPDVAIGNTELWSLLFLAHGVTSVRETGSVDGRIFETRDAIRAGRFPGPRIFACGRILDGDPPSFPTNRVVGTPEEGRVVVREAAARGAPCVKVYNTMTPEVLDAVRTTAHELGLSVVGHLPHAVPLAEAGIDDLQHGTGAPFIDPEKTGRLDFRLEDWEAVDDRRIDHVVARALAHGTAHTLALVNPRRRLWMQTPGDHGRDSGLRHLPRFWRAAWAMIWRPPYAPGDAARRALHDHFLERSAALALALYRAGATLHAGTDTLMPYVAPGSSLWGELDAWVDLGVPPEDILARATRIDPRFVGGERLGRVEPGAPADLLFLRDDPRRGLAALRHIEAVLADGRLYTRADLDRALARFDAHFRGALYERTMDTVIAAIGGRFAPDD